MKRSRIILGLAALGVAAFGAFAFTSNRMATNAEYIRSSDSSCQPVTVEKNCPVGDPTCIKPSSPDLGAQLYQRNSNCETALQDESGF